MKDDSSTGGVGAADAVTTAVAFPVAVGGRLDGTIGAVAATGGVAGALIVLTVAGDSTSTPTFARALAAVDGRDGAGDRD